MAYHANVYKILIASPSDVNEGRNAITEVINNWNATYSENSELVLMPVKWETHSIPEMGDRPQAIINEQLVDKCDILIGIFWSRIGSPTGVEESGSIEEITRFIKAKKPVMLYFCNAPIPQENLESDQYEKLKLFENFCRKNGIIETYSSLSELREKLANQLSNTVKKIQSNPTYKNTNSNETLNANNEVVAEFKKSVMRLETHWNAERKSKRADIDEGKKMLANLEDSLINFKVDSISTVDEDTLNKIDVIITTLKELKRHRERMDGGQSYRAFWEEGDKVFAALREF